MALCVARILEFRVADELGVTRSSSLAGFQKVPTYQYHRQWFTSASTTFALPLTLALTLALPVALTLALPVALTLALPVPVHMPVCLQ